MSNVESGQGLPIEPAAPEEMTQGAPQTEELVFQFGPDEQGHPTIDPGYQQTLNKLAEQPDYEVSAHSSCGGTSVMIQQKGSGVTIWTDGHGRVTRMSDR